VSNQKRHALSCPPNRSTNVNWHNRQHVDWRNFVGHFKYYFMQTLKKILRFRFDDEIVNALRNVRKLSEYVRQAVREKLVKDGYLKEPELPF